MQKWAYPALRKIKINFKIQLLAIFINPIYKFVLIVNIKRFLFLIDCGLKQMHLNFRSQFWLFLFAATVVCIVVNNNKSGPNWHHTQ